MKLLSTHPQQLLVLVLCFFSVVTLKAETEPNDSFEQATETGLNMVQNGYLDTADDKDWFLIHVPIDGRLTILDTTSETLDYIVNLYEADGTTLIEGRRRFMDNTGGNLSISLVPGNYYLQFDRYSIGAEGTYEFIAEFVDVTRSGDEEPNDVAASAQNIALNESISANLGHRKISVYDDKDWFKFTVEKDGRLTVQDTTTAYLDYIINLYETDGTTLITSERRYTDNSGGILDVNLAPGVYYLMFDKYSFNFSTYGEYAFTAQFIEVKRSGDIESNDIVDDAQSIALNQSVSANLGNRKTGVYDDKDWFKFTVEKDGRLTVQDTTTAHLDYIINLYETDGTTLITSDRRYTDNSGGILDVNLAPGVYYLMFDKYSFDFSTYGEYAFTPEFIEVTRIGDTEPNDVFEKAHNISVNESVSANLGNRKIGQYDDKDWFAFSVEHDGRLTVQDTTTAALDYIVTLYESDGTTKVTSQRRYMSNFGSEIAVSLSPGDYYLMFDKYSFDFSTYGEYWFTPEYIKVAKPGDIEPNESIAQAGLLKIDSTSTGNLGHRRVGFYDDIDWWKIDVWEDGILTLLDTNAVTVDYNITLYNAIDTSLIKSVRRYYDGSGSLISVKVDSGKYFVRLDKYSFDFSSYGEYEITPDFLPKPKANFTITRNVSSFVFTNKTIDGETYEWDFGDENSSTEVSPGHTYEFPGEYKVCLIASNEAGKDTICKYVTIYGIQKIVDNVGGNTGDVSVDVYGGGFTAESKVKLTRSGYDDIPADTVLNLKRGVLSTLFDLRGTDVGKWNLVVETPNQTPIIEVDGYTIEQGVQAEPWVEIIGRSRALIGRWSTYTINYGNRGNVDASGVPLWIAVSRMADTNIQFLDFEVVPPPYAVNTLGLESTLRDSVPIYFDTDTLFGEAFLSRIYPLIIPIIPAGQSGQLTIKVKSLENFQIMAWTNPPMFKSPMSQEVKDCIFWAQMKAIGDGIISIAGDAIPAGGCINSVVTNYIYNPWSVDKPGDDKPKSIQSHMWTLASTIINCAGDIPIFKAYKLTVSILQLGAAIIDNSIADRECRAAFANKSKRKVKVRTVTSFDPNEKDGPEGYTDNNYILKTPTVGYTVYFENKDTAQAPAQEILVVDSIDMDVFDIANFNFSSITVADTTIAILSGLNQFSLDIDMQPEMAILTRVTGHIDTLSGVVTWLFKALDPITLDDNENPDLGVLLPNHLPPEGEGNVSFNIGLKDEVADGDTITNEAVITFDFNKPIVTNSYTCIIDSEKPQSKLSIGTEIRSTSNQLSLSIEGSDAGSGIDLYTIYLSVDDSEFVPVINTAESSINYMPKDNGVHKFYTIATDKLGNSEDAPSAPDATVNVVLSTDEITISDYDVKIWPNPTTGVINVDMTGLIDEDVLLELKSIVGQVVLVKHLGAVSNEVYKLDVSGFAAGVYLLSVSTKTSDNVYKVVMK